MLNRVWAFFATSKITIICLWRYGLRGAIPHLNEHLRMLEIENKRLRNLVERKDRGEKAM